VTEARRIRAVFFDVGETLVDESRDFGGWADWLGVPRHTFFAVLGQVIARGEDHRAVFQHFRPGFDLAVERERRGEAYGYGEGDLYPDARPCLRALKADGYFVGVVGNQPARTAGLLRDLDLGVDLIATSAGWGVEKPSPAFFERVVEASGFGPGEVAYVGDRLDNDILPARAAGLVTVFVKRGPWGHHHAGRPEAMLADLRIDDLTDLPARLAALSTCRPR